MKVFIFSLACIMAAVAIASLTLLHRTRTPSPLQRSLEGTSVQAWSEQDFEAVSKYLDAGVKPELQEKVISLAFEQAREPHYDVRLWAALVKQWRNKNGFFSVPNRMSERIKDVGYEPALGACFRLGELDQFVDYKWLLTEGHDYDGAAQFVGVNTAPDTLVKYRSDLAVFLLREDVPSSAKHAMLNAITMNGVAYSKLIFLDRLDVLSTLCQSDDEALVQKVTSVLRTIGISTTASVTGSRPSIP